MSFRTASVIQQFFLDSAMVKNGSMIELAWRISGKFERLASRGMVLIGALVFFYTHPHKNRVFFCFGYYIRTKLTFQRSRKGYTSTAWGGRNVPKHASPTV